eukprot:6093885-Pleurochrysis_carterae.AAC.1
MFEPRCGGWVVGAQLCYRKLLSSASLDLTTRRIATEKLVEADELVREMRAIVDAPRAGVLNTQA